jgi:hypothetical protein
LTPPPTVIVSRLQNINEDPPTLKNVMNLKNMFGFASVSQGFYIQTTFLHLGGYHTANTNIISILQSLKYKIDFHPLRESNMYLHAIGSTRTLRSLITCSRSGFKK